MRNYLRGFGIIISLLILVIFIIFVINQTAQVVNLAGHVHPLMGEVTFWFLLAVYGILIVVPLFYFLRLPRALTPPASEDDEDFEEYLKLLSRRLRRHPLLRGRPISNRREIEAALKILDENARQLIKKNATTIFVTTAISQSGRLDAFTVLIMQIRMVWQVARLYYQRPSLREVMQLYSNVAATAFIAGELNDLDISEQVEPIITSVLGGTLSGAIPGVNNVASIITNSLLTGSANAFLTLRVGIISQQYCGSLVKRERKLVRRSATAQAAKMLSIIVMSSAGSISRSIINAAVKSPAKLSRSVAKSAWGRISGKGKSEPETTR